MLSGGIEAAEDAALLQRVSGRATQVRRMRIHAGFAAEG
jgi:hypothetical protein